MRASEAQRRVEGRSCTPPRADKTTAFDLASSTSELSKQQQMDINKMDVNMIPTAQERHVCRPTKTKPNKLKQTQTERFVIVLAAFLRNSISFCSTTLSRRCITPGSLLFARRVRCPLCHQDVAHRERQGNSRATGVEIGSLARGGKGGSEKMAYFVLSRLPCLRRAPGHTWPFWPDRSHKYAHTKRWTLHGRWPVACFHSLVESISAGGWSHIMAQPKVVGCLRVTETEKKKKNIAHLKDGHCRRR